MTNGDKNEKSNGQPKESDQINQDAKKDACKAEKEGKACSKGCCEEKKEVKVEIKEEKEDGCKKKCCEGKEKKEDKVEYDVATLIKWGKYAIALAVFTIVYNVGEGVVAIYYGWEEESISLLGFGCDSFVEVFSATIVLIQLIIKDKI